MRPLALGLALASFVILALPAAFAQNMAEGQIYSMSTAPESPVVFEPVTTSIGVTNPSDRTINYKLEVIASKDGAIKHSEVFVFTLDPGLGTFVSSSFVPDDIGKFEVVAKLTDQFETDLKDVRLREFIVVSEIGPFDIAIDSPSEIITPGTKTPLILTLANMGEKATDVQVRVIFECNVQPSIAQEFFVFLFPGSVVDKQITTDTCQEVGPHDITASIVLFNRTWISAVNQVFLNESFIELVFEPPEVITVRAGEPQIFYIKVTNAGNEEIDNLRLLLPNIQPEWIRVTPTSIVQTAPGETVVFIVNITLPRESPSDEVVIGVSAAADQVLERRETRLRVLSFEGAAPVGAVELPELPKLPALPRLPSVDIAGLIAGNAAYIGVGVIVAVGGLVGGMRLKRSRMTFEERLEGHYEEMRRLKKKEEKEWKRLKRKYSGRRAKAK